VPMANEGGAPDNITVIVVDTEEATAEPTAEPTETTLNGVRVLIVEDDPDAREIAQRVQAAAVKLRQVMRFDHAAYLQPQSRGEGRS